MEQFLFFGHKPSPSISIAKMEDADALDGSGTRHGSDSAALLKKLNQLTLAQAEYLLLELRIFWEQISGIENGMDEFMKEYAAS